MCTISRCKKTLISLESAGDRFLNLSDESSKVPCACHRSLAPPDGRGGPPGRSAPRALAQLLEAPIVLCGVTTPAGGAASGATRVRALISDGAGKERAPRSLDYERQRTWILANWHGQIWVAVPTRTATSYDSIKVR